MEIIITCFIGLWLAIASYVAYKKLQKDFAGLKKN